jgi:hypothetical protein
MFNRLETFVLLGKKTETEFEVIFKKLFINYLQNFIPMKQIFSTLVLLIATVTVFSQDIKLKDGIVLLDGKEVFTYEKQNWGDMEIHLYALGTKDAVLYMKKNSNETPTFYDDDFTQIRFLTFGKLLETKSDKPWPKLIEWIFQNKVFDQTGQFSEEKVDLMIKNYDENITARTVR